MSDDTHAGVLWLVVNADVALDHVPAYAVPYLTLAQAERGRANLDRIATRRRPNLVIYRMAYALERVHPTHDETGPVLAPDPAPTGTPQCTERSIADR